MIENATEPAKDQFAYADRDEKILIDYMKHLKAVEKLSDAKIADRLNIEGCRGKRGARFNRKLVFYYLKRARERNA